MNVHADHEDRPATAASNSHPRRHFLKTAAAAGAATALSAKSYAAVAGANERVRVAAVGVRGMGFGHVKAYAQLDKVEVAAICDVDRALLDQRVADTEKLGLPRPDAYVDIRKLLEDDSIDAISVATPNHWHALAGFWAAQAGKHSTLEKPCTHNVFEGQQLIKASERYGVLIQQHAERRSSEGVKAAIEFLHSGGIGEVYLAKGICYKWRESIGKMPVARPPEHVDYDLWLGPAPERPFTENRFHYNWHWHWDYGNGDIGNQGAHQMDLARWGLGVEFPTRVMSMGGHFLFDDDQETPNTQMALFEFANPAAGGDKKKMLEFEVRHWIGNHEGGFGEGGGNNIGNIFYGSEGYLTIAPGGEWKTYLGKKREPGPSGEGTGDMWKNFIDSIRAGDRSMLEGDIVEGHRSCTLIHVANISCRLGRSLEFDPSTETFRDDPEANAMLTRDYRKPFVVGEVG